MQNMTKRLLCLVLTVVMVLSMLPAVFATDAAADAVAENTTTGVQYESLDDALLEAADGQKIRLLQNTQGNMLTVFENVKLDLNGYTLTANYLSCFGNVVDTSADNAGLLCVSSERFMLQETNSQLPVKTAEGYRFVQLSGFNTAMVNETKYVFQPLFETAAHGLLAQGREVTGVSVQVYVSWQQGEGTRYQTFSFNDSHLQGFLASYKAASNKYSKQFALTLLGAENIENLQFSARIVSDTGVVFDAAELESKPEGNLPVDEDNKLVGDVTLESTHGEALVAEGTQLEQGATTLTLTTTAMDETTSDLEVDKSQQLTSLDVHVQGVAADNTVPVIVTLNELAPEFLNKGNIALYHVENGVTVEMTRVYSLEELDAHNEFYYDVITGTVTVAIASFSEIVVRTAKENAWNGQTDTSWYNTTDTSFTIYNADQLAGLGAIVDGKAENIAYDTFDNKVIKLGFDIDLYGKYTEAERGDKEEYRSFDPIGYSYEDYAGGRVFKGELDGQGHTIRNLFQHGWDMGYSYGTQGGGLFASVVDAKIHDLVIDGAKVVMECVDMGTLVGYAYGTCEFKNIIVQNSVIANYNRYTGGVVGEVGGTHVFDNVDVDSTTTVSALWGTFDPSCGGIIGGKWGEATVTMKNCDVACVLDVYNDVTSAYRWYSYRRCGMLIGFTEQSKTVNGRTEAIADFLTTENCTVQYGDWAKYTYCEFEHTYPYVRVQKGLYNDAYSNPRYGHPVDVTGKTVVDDVHTHRAGEDHQIPVYFEQLYGGGQGCYGGNSHLGNGVTVLTNVQSAKKFEAKQDFIVVQAGLEYKLGDLVQATNNGEPIQPLNVMAYISPANVEDVGKISGSFVRDNSWTDSVLKFNGMGKATVTIDDYYYCEPTVLTVYIQPEFTVHVQQSYSNVEVGNNQYNLFLTAKDAVTLGAYSYTFNGQQVAVAYDAENAVVADDHPIQIGSFTVPSGTEVSLTDVQIDGVFDVSVPGVVTQAEGYFHPTDHTGWTAWGDDAAEKTTLPTESGKYYLTQDITLTTQASYDNQDVFLCLNGKTITNTCTNNVAYRDRAYSVGNNGILSICDCTAHLNEAGEYVAGKITDMSQGAIIVPSTTSTQAKRNAAVYLYDGILTGSTLSENSAMVLIQSSSRFNMYGGRITGNKNVGQVVDGVYDKDFGGGVYVSESLFNFYDGQITNNTSTRGGGMWIVSNSTVNMYDGLVSGNTAYHNAGNTAERNKEMAYEKGWGGGIYISGSQLNIYGGQISDNTAYSNGGGIFAVNAKVHMQDVLFTGNEAVGIEEAVTQEPPKENTNETTAPTGESTPADANTPATIDDEVTGDGNEDLGGDNSDITDDTTGDVRIMSGTGYGGAFHLANTTAYLENVVFDKNTASHAGGMFITGGSKATLKDVTMTGNKCYSTGAMALYAEASSQVEIIDGVITENYNEPKYGNASSAIYLPNDATVLKLSGKPYIYGNLRTDAQGSTYARDIYLQNTIYTDGPGHAKLTLGVLTEGAKLTVITQCTPNENQDYCEGLQWLLYDADTVNNWSGSYLQYLHYKTRAIAADVEQGLLYLAEPHRAENTHEGEATWTAYGVGAKEKNTLPAVSGHYYLTQDIVMTENRSFVDGQGVSRDVGVCLDGDQQITICLNGHSIEAFSRLYRISGNASVTICNCTDEGKIVAGGGYSLDGTDYAINGGVICTTGANAAANVKLENITIEGNASKTVSFGGAVCMNGGSGKLTVEHVTMKNLKAGIVTTSNDTTHYYGGGAIYVNGCVVTLTDSIFNNCDTTAASGGAIQAVGDAGLTVKDCQFIGCDSTLNGGAITYTGTQPLSITGTSFETCTATGSGAAVYCRNEKNSMAVTVTGCTFTDCRAGSNAALVVNAVNSTLTINGDSKFENCTSGGSGGAVYVATSTALTVENAQFISCASQNLNGGAICNASTAEMRLSQCSFTGCSAADQGGAIVVNNGTIAVSVTGSTFENCQAGNNGGAIGVMRAKTVQISDSTFTGCKAVGTVVNGTPDWTTGMGGALYLKSVAQTDITNTNFNGNQIEGGNAIRGGAIYNMSTVLNITGGTMENNSATQYGAFHTSNTSTVTMNGVKIINNHADTTIGAINVEQSSRLTLKDCTITGNTSVGYGAVYVFNKNSSLTIEGSTKISGNTLTNGTSSNLYLLTGASTGSSMAMIVKLVDLTEGAEIYFNVGFDKTGYHEYSQGTRIAAAANQADAAQYLYSDVVNQTETPKFEASTAVTGYSYIYTIYNPYI